MATANSSKINLSSLDFDSLKTQLINYLSSQNTITDYNYTGSVINQLLNLLTYNSTLLSFYLNAAINESFLDSAVLYPNIVSRAKVMGYVPVSNTAAQAIVNVVVTKAVSDSTTALTLPAFTPFSSSPLNGTSYNFLTVDSMTVANVGNQFTFNNVIIKEGQPVTKTFVVDSITNPSQTFDLGDVAVDTNTISVTVQVSNTNIQQSTFLYASDATSVGNNSNVYYLNMSGSGTWQIYFGDGILGKQLDDGNLVTVSYLNTSAAAGNGLNVFQLQSPLLSGSTSNVTTVVASAGGSGSETGAEIKFSAPKSYLSQNRCVTVDDYQNIIDKKYPYFQAVNVFGGEDLSPPIYGQVFICALPLTGFQVTQAQQQYVINQIIAKLIVLGITPVFIPVNENWLNFAVSVYYDPTATSLTPAQLQTAVTNAAYFWANSNLNQFNTTFYINQFLDATKNADPSIVGTDAQIYIQKIISPTLNEALSYTLPTNIPLAVGTSSAKLYSSPPFTEYDASGNPQQCYIEEVPQSSTGIESINVTSKGNGYLQAPSLLIQGDGTGANAYAIIVNGAVTSVIVDEPGVDYTQAVVTAIGGNGSGATFDAVIEGSWGTLRSFYYANNIKTIMTANVGTINYPNGVITLTNFAPINVSNPANTLSIYVPPAVDIFSSQANTILTLNQNDPAAITVTVNVDNN